VPAPVAQNIPLTAVAPPGFSGGRIDYVRDVEPIFQANCVKCHNGTKKKGGYRLDAREHIFAAGESGTAAIVPGKSDDSRLIKMVEGKGDFADSVMPPKGPPLSFQQIQLIRRWIDEGALSSTP
jgi:mono/diheme cytochrome c family protein